MGAQDHNEIDRRIGEILAAEREWAWKARERGDSRAGKLCLAAIATIEAAMRRVQEIPRDYPYRLVAALNECLAAWEGRPDDEDGYGSSSIHKVLRAAQDWAAPTLDEECLIESAFNGAADEVREWLAKGLRLDARDESGLSALHMAAASEEPGGFEAAKLLLDRGADPNASSGGGMTPLYMLAYSNDYSDVARLLIARGADIEARAKDGSTPLHEAALWGRVQVARLLLQAGANVEARTDAGQTARDIAVEQGCSILAALLLRPADGREVDFEVLLRRELAEEVALPVLVSAAWRGYLLACSDWLIDDRADALQRLIPEPEVEFEPLRVCIAEWLQQGSEGGRISDGLPGVELSSLQAAAWRSYVDACVDGKVIGGREANQLARKIEARALREA